MSLCQQPYRLACLAITAVFFGGGGLAAGTVQSVKWMEDRPSGVTMVQSRLATLGGSRLARDPAKFTVHAVDLQAGEYTDPQTGKRMAYRYFLPPDLAPNAQVPLVLFLHGMGDGGRDNLRQLTVHEGPLAFVQPEWQKRFPCILVAPTDDRGIWVNASFDKPSESLRMAVAIVDKLAAETGHVDARRLYVTGLSSGGIGTWEAVKKFPGKFAAAAPISAWYDIGPRKFWPKRMQTAVWAFYNSRETEGVRKGCNGTLGMVAKLGGEARMTVYAAGGHDAWSAAYKEPDFAPWLFRQRLDGGAVAGTVVGKLAGK